MYLFSHKAQCSAWRYGFFALSLSPAFGGKRIPVIQTYFGNSQNPEGSRQYYVLQYIKDDLL
jgi:hypothetical protein